MRSRRSRASSRTDSGATRAASCGRTAPTTRRRSSSRSAPCWGRSRTSSMSFAQGARIGALGVKCFRPYPLDEVREALAGAERVVVIEGVRRRRRWDRRSECAPRALGPPAARARCRRRPRRAARSPGDRCGAVRRRARGPARATPAPFPRPQPRARRAGTRTDAEGAPARSACREHPPRPRRRGRRLALRGTRCPSSRSSSFKPAASRSATGSSIPSSAPCRRAWSARTRSPAVTGRARAAARRSGRGSRSMPRCVPPTAT